MKNAEGSRYLFWYLPGSVYHLNQLEDPDQHSFNNFRKIFPADSWMENNDSEEGNLVEPNFEEKKDILKEEKTKDDSNNLGGPSSEKTTNNST